MPQANPMPQTLLAYTATGDPVRRLTKRPCEWPSTPGLHGLDHAVETVLMVLEDVYGFTFIERAVVGRMLSRDVLAHAGFPEVECGPLYGWKARLVNAAIGNLTPTDYVQVTWKVAGWLHLCARPR